MEFPALAQQQSDRDTKEKRNETTTTTAITSVPGNRPSVRENRSTSTGGITTPWPLESEEDEKEREREVRIEQW